MSMDELRREARRLEHALDAELMQLGRSDLSDPCASSGGVEARTRDVQASLTRLQEVNDAMSRAASAAPSGRAATTLHTLQRCLATQRLSCRAAGPGDFRSLP
mmetsp:Transcript_17896/g.60028  ORF Transcript_17896/g.60028 Transcript_17896/m.60028 type:complete len:103 (-) Transcript_17896:588-896(-)